MRDAGKFSDQISQHRISTTNTNTTVTITTTTITTVGQVDF